MRFGKKNKPEATPAIGKDKKTKKPWRTRINTRKASAVWLAVVIAGTGAWYMLVAQADAKEIERLENSIVRSERDLEGNRTRVSELEAEISELEARLAAAESEYEQYQPYLTTFEPAERHVQRVTGKLAEEAGLTITDVTSPQRWTATAPQHHTISYTLDVTGTYNQLVAALSLIEQQEAGLSIRELQVVKAGGNPDDPTLNTRITIQAHARQKE